LVGFVFILFSITDSICLASRIRHGQSPRFGATESFDEIFCSLAVELLGLMMEATGEQAHTV